MEAGGTPPPRSLCTTALWLMEMPLRSPLSPAATMPSPRAWVTVKPLNRMSELSITTAAKIVCVPRPGMSTLSVGVTPVWSMVARWPCSDSGLVITTCS